MKKYGCISSTVFYKIKQEKSGHWISTILKNQLKVCDQTNIDQSAGELQNNTICLIGFPEILVSSRAHSAPKIDGHTETNSTYGFPLVSETNFTAGSICVLEMGRPSDLARKIQQTTCQRS